GVGGFVRKKERIGRSSVKVRAGRSLPAGRVGLGDEVKIAVAAAVTTSGNVAAGKAVPSVTLRDVTIAFRLAGGAAYTAVQNASLAVGAGEVVAVMGPTGCGKSALRSGAARLM